MRTDEEILADLKKSNWKIRYVSKEKRSDKNFCIKALKASKYIYFEKSFILKKDKDIIKYMFYDSYPDLLNYIRPNLTYDELRENTTDEEFNEMFKIQTETKKKCAAFYLYEDLMFQILEHDKNFTSKEWFEYSCYTDQDYDFMQLNKAFMEEVNLLITKVGEKNPAAFPSLNILRYQSGPWGFANPDIDNLRVYKEFPFHLNGIAQMGKKAIEYHIKNYDSKSIYDLVDAGADSNIPSAINYKRFQKESLEEFIDRLPEEKEIEEAKTLVRTRLL